MNTTIRCASCKHLLPAEWAMIQSDQRCPKCGEVEQEVLLEADDAVKVGAHENVRMQGKDPAFSSKRNPRLDVFAGEDLRKSDGRWMKKERIIDKDKNLYRETVVVPATGDIVHHKEEPLSDHFGHGSAKTKKSDEA